MSRTCGSAILQRNVANQRQQFAVFFGQSNSLIRKAKAKLHPRKIELVVSRSRVFWSGARSKRNEAQSPGGALSVAIVDKGQSLSESTHAKPPADVRSGRTLKLEPHVVSTVSQMVREGNYPKIACAAAGISADTLEAWRKRGNNDEEPYADFTRKLA